MNEIDKSAEEDWQEFEEGEDSGIEEQMFKETYGKSSEEFFAEESDDE